MMTFSKGLDHQVAPFMDLNFKYFKFIFRLLWNVKPYKMPARKYLGEVNWHVKKMNFFFNIFFSPVNNSWKDLILQMTSDHCKMFGKAYERYWEICGQRQMCSSLSITPFCSNLTADRMLRRWCFTPFEIHLSEPEFTVMEWLDYYSHRWLGNREEDCLYYFFIVNKYLLVKKSIF